MDINTATVAMALTGHKEKESLPSVEAASVSSSSSVDNSSMVGGISIGHGASASANDGEDEDNSEGDSNQEVPPSLMLPTWLQELDAKADHSKDDLLLLDSDAESVHSQKTDNSRASSSINAPDWLQDFETQQTQLLEALADSYSHRGGGSIFLKRNASSLLQEDTLSIKVDINSEHSTSKASNFSPNLTDSRQSIAPAWLMEFQAEQQELLQALDAHSANAGAAVDNFDDSFAMMNQDESFPDKEALIIPNVKNRVSMELEPGKAETAIAHTEEIKPKSGETSTSLPSATGVPGAFLNEPSARPLHKVPSKRGSIFAGRPSIMPDWLLEFEAQQQRVFQALDRTTRMSTLLSGNDSMLMAPEITFKSKDDETKRRESNASSRPSILAAGAPDWLKDLEAQQRSFLEELELMNSSATLNKADDTKSILEDDVFVGLDDSEEEEEPELLVPSYSKKKPVSLEKHRNPVNTTLDTMDTATTASLTPTRVKSSYSIDSLSSTTALNTKLNTIDHEFQGAQLRKSPTAMERQKTETSLEFAQMIAKAITNKGGSSNLEALRHMDDLKRDVALLKEETAEVGSSDWQMKKLRQELLDFFEQCGTLREEDSMKWLLPLYDDERTGSVVMNADQVALLQSFSSADMDEKSGLGVVRTVLQSNFKAVNGSLCLEAISDYAMLKFGKKKKRPKNLWVFFASVIGPVSKEASPEEIHQRVCNALVLWVVREIVGTSKDQVSSRKCFQAIFVVASLKLELERLDPSTLDEHSHSGLGSSSRPASSKQGVKRVTSRKGILASAPRIIKKLLDRDQVGPRDAPPSDIPPGESGAASASDKVAFVRETLAKTEEDTLEEKSRIRYRHSTFVKFESNRGINDTVVADAVSSFQMPTTFEEDTEEPAWHLYSTSKGDKNNAEMMRELDRGAQRRGAIASSDTKPRRTAMLTASNQVSALLEIRKAGKDVTPASKANMLGVDSGRGTLVERGPLSADATTSTSVSEFNMDIDSSSKHDSASSLVSDEKPSSSLPLSLQDAHRVIRSILGPGHTVITVSLCFEALRVFAAMILTWREINTERDHNEPGDISSRRREPSSEELKLKSLEGSMLRRGGILVPPAQIDLRLEEEREEAQRRQKIEERAARMSIARKRDEKKKKKLKKKRSKGHKKVDLEVHAEQDESSHTEAY